MPKGIPNMPARSRDKGDGYHAARERWAAAIEAFREECLDAADLEAPHWMIRAAEAIESATIDMRNQRKGRGQ